MKLSQKLMEGDLYHLQDYKELPCLPRLQEERRIGGTLIGFLMLDLYETFTEASEG